MSFGANAGDSAENACDDCQWTIPLGFSYYYFTQFYTDIIITSNGYVSFGSIGLSISVPASSNSISAYNYDLATSTCGTLWYRSITDSTTLTKISSQINSYYAPVTSFTATNAFVATWDHICRLSSPGLYGTFQIIIATDGVQHYLMINYGTLDYSCYASGSFYQYIDANNVVVKNLLPTTPQSSSNVNFNGKWIYPSCSGKFFFYVNLYKNLNFKALSVDISIYLILK